ncbi:lantibiotic dehydratase [Chitinophaga polysaccharea]|uniref:lantibiotic dehydratase n=1 Tax=Chitinophaga polysaccharea TaxID=1293035 RepID=UPI001158D67C|nr:lantibiotic dehydratase [Chitinophaga polysaccharea]
MEHKRDFFIHDHYLLRTPALPVDDIFKLNGETAGLNLNDANAIMKVINDLLSNSLFYEALFVGSRAVFNTYNELKDKSPVDLHKVRKLLFSLYKYFARMAVRSTPYGLFSGVTAGSVNDAASSILFAENKYRVSFEFNIDVIADLILQVGSHPEYKARIQYSVNNTLYEIDDKLLFVEQAQVNGGLQSRLSSVTVNDVIRHILQRARGGATISELVATIDVSATYQQKEKFVMDLIRSQVLVNEFYPSVSSRSFVHDFLAKARQHQISLPQVDELQKIYDAFNATTGINDLPALRASMMAQSLEYLRVESDFFKADLFYNTQTNNINRKIITEISEECFELSSLVPPKSAPDLEQFRHQFHRRYEEREIPLVQALDPNYGIGYGNAITGVAEYMPLIEGMPVVNPPQKINTHEDYLETIRKTVFRRFCEKKEHVVDIAPTELQASRKRNESKFNGKVPTNTYIFGTLIADSLPLLDSGNYKFQLVQTHAPFAAKLLTRFANGDATISNNIRQIISEETTANQDVILAEIVYLPSGNYANIVLRPPFRQYEIPYISQSRLDAGCQININDIMVSVRDNRVVLRSQRLDKEIIPCLTNSHYTFFGQPIYKFLADCSAQHVVHGFIWDWGELAAEKFLPRITYKHLVLSRARWLLPQTILDHRKEHIVEEYVDSLRNSRQLPRHVLLAEGDNELLLDLDNPICRQILAKELGKKEVTLCEFLQSPENCFLKQHNSSFTNEMLITMGTHRPMRPGQLSKFVAPQEIKRIFPPGSEWLYLKVYTGNKVQERILTEYVSDFARMHLEAGTLDKWFFIRYSDPGHHLRIRIHRASGADMPKWHSLTEQFEQGLEQFLTANQVINITIDTYHREIERYGAALIEATETLFYIDSVAITNFLSLLGGNEGEHWRWLFALVNIDRLLDDFNYDIAGKRALLEKLSNMFLHEFSMKDKKREKLLIKMMNDRYRRFQKDIADILLNRKADAKLTDAYNEFHKRSIALEPEIASLNNLAYFRNNKDRLMNSYIHMSMNRMFMVNQRSHELVTYYFLNRFYTSVAAQKKQLNEYHQ